MGIGMIIGETYRAVYVDAPEGLYAVEGVGDCGEVFYEAGGC